MCKLYRIDYIITDTQVHSGNFEFFLFDETIPHEHALKVLRNEAKIKGYSFSVEIVTAKVVDLSDIGKATRYYQNAIK